MESQVPHREEIEGARKFWERNQVQGAWELCLLSEWVVTLHIVGYVCAMNEPKHFYPAISGGTGSSDPLPEVSALYIALLCTSDIDSRTSFTNGRLALREASDNETQNIELPPSTGDSNTHKTISFYSSLRNPGEALSRLMSLGTDNSVIEAWSETEHSLQDRRTHWLRLWQITS